MDDFSYRVVEFAPRDGCPPTLEIRWCRNLNGKWRYSYPIGELVEHPSDYKEGEDPLGDLRQTVADITKALDLPVLQEGDFEKHHSLADF